MARRLADISALDDASARGFVPELRQQALSTVAVENARGWRIAKEKRGNKIDAISCIGHGLCLGNPEDLSMSAIGRRWTAPEEVKVETAFDIFKPLRGL